MRQSYEETSAHQISYRNTTVSRPQCGGCAQCDRSRMWTTVAAAFGAAMPVHIDHRKPVAINEFTRIVRVRVMNSVILKGREHTRHVNVAL